MHSDKLLGELVTFNNSKGLHLDGILYQKDENETTIIHIHGSLGNFYQNQFLRLMARKYLHAGLNMLSFNLAGHDGVGEGYRNINDFEYVGGSIADFSTSVSDIESAVEFVRPFSKRIVLQGHSLGCDRILNFLIYHKLDYDFILLSPCDSYQLQTLWIAPETVEQQVSRLKMHSSDENVFDWLPSREYGIRNKNEYYNIPITRRALLSIMEGPPFRLIRINAPAQFFLNQRVLIYIGGADPLQVWKSDAMYRYFEDRVREVKRVYIPHGDHDLVGCESAVVEEIIKWV